MGPLNTKGALRVLERFESLPVQKRVEVFKNLSPTAREELIKIVARPGEIMRMISPEEAFFTIKELGAENALGLVSATTASQLQYLLDIDLWKKDMLDTESAAHWLEIICKAGEHKILQFLQTSDPELIASAVNRLIRVEVRNPDIDLVEQADELPYFTLDGVFFIEFLVPRAEEALKDFIDAMFRWNTKYYFGLMESIAHGLNMENEELAGKWRRSRLADRGFPEFDEALEIYQYLKSGAISPPGSDGLRGEGESAVGYRQALEYPIKVLEQQSLFKRSLDKITNPEVTDRLSVELAHLGNKVMVADGRDPGLSDNLLGSLRKVSGYINMALEEICDDDVSQAAELLKSNHMEILFRRGFSLILDLRREAQRFLREYEGGVENLGHPLAPLMTGLLQKRPYYAANVVGSDKARDFERLDDIVTIRKMLDRSALEESWEPI